MGLSIRNETSCNHNNENPMHLDEGVVPVIPNKTRPKTATSNTLAPGFVRALPTALFSRVPVYIEDGKRRLSSFLLVNKSGQFTARSAR